VFRQQLAARNLLEGKNVGIFQIHQRQLVVLSKLFGKEQEIAALSKADVKRTDNTEARSDVRYK